jgi:GT2 family glycosyltransferase
VTATAAVVVVHEPRPELDACVRALAPQVDELVVVANLLGELPLPDGVRLIRNESPLGYAANVNRGIGATSAPYVVVANPDT